MSAGRPAAVPPADEAARFAGKVAVVTGAASGIGRDTCARLGGEGARLLALDVDEAGLAGLARELRAAGVALDVAPCDVTDASSVRAALGGGVADRVDVLVNAAGVGWTGHALEVTDEEWDRVIGINLAGTFRVIREVVPRMLEHGGAVVNVASIGGLAGRPYLSIYCASKGGVVLLTQSLAAELAGQGVRFNSVCPGSVATPLRDGLQLPDGTDPALVARGRALTPATSAEPDEIAAAIAYLASDEASFVTGSNLVIDGGALA